MPPPRRVGRSFRRRDVLTGALLVIGALWLVVFHLTHTSLSQKADQRSAAQQSKGGLADVAAVHKVGARPVVTRGKVKGGGLLPNTYDHLLFQFRNESIQIQLISAGPTACIAPLAQWQEYFAHARIYQGIVSSAAPDVAISYKGERPQQPGADLVLFCSANKDSLAAAEWDAFQLLFRTMLRPGGLFGFAHPAKSTARKLLSVVDVLNRGFFDETFQVFDGDRQVRSLFWVDGAVLLAKKSAVCDIAPLAEGDYGKKFGDGENAVAFRALQRNLGMPWEAEDRQFFYEDVALQSERVLGARVGLRFKWRKMATALMADDAKGSGQPKPKELARCAKRRSLASIAAADIGMALAVDPKRVRFGRPAHVTAKLQEPVILTLLPQGNIPLRSVRFKKAVGWSSSAAYYGKNSPPVSTVALAQTWRNKAIMPDSDFWKGCLTSAAVKTVASITLLMTDDEACARHKAITARLKMKCERAVGEAGPADEVRRHAPFWALFYRGEQYSLEEYMPHPFTALSVSQGGEDILPGALPGASLYRIMPGGGRRRLLLQEEAGLLDGRRQLLQDEEEEEEPPADPANENGYSFKVLPGDAGDAATLETMLRQAGKLNLVSDDGGTPTETQRSVFEAVMDGMLVAGGLYLMQDVELSYEKGDGCKAHSSIALLKEIALRLIHGPRTTGVDRAVENIMFHKNLAIVSTYSKAT